MRRLSDELLSLEVIKERNFRASPGVKLSEKMLFLPIWSRFRGNFQMSDMYAPHGRCHKHGVYLDGGCSMCRREEAARQMGQTEEEAISKEERTSFRLGVLAVAMIGVVLVYAFA